MTFTEPVRSREMSLSTGAYAVLEVLRAWGADTVFICPGSTEAALLDAMAEVDSPRLVLTTDEAVTVAMADGYARATGRPAVAYLHTHLGLENGLAHLGAAALAHSPVVVLNGLKSTQMQRLEGFTTARGIADLARVHCRWHRLTTSAGDVVGDVDEAVRQAMMGPGGPVWLGIPQDLLERSQAPLPAAYGPRPMWRADPPAEAVRAAAALIAAAERPVVVVGADAVGAERAIDALADVLDAPVLDEDRWSCERTMVAWDHPRFAGALGASGVVAGECDLVVLAGARSPIPNDPVAKPAIPPGAAVVQLHTDPDELGRRMPGATLVPGDVATAAARLAVLVEAPSVAVRTERARFRLATVDEHQAALEARRAIASDARDDAPLVVDALMAELAALVTEESVVVSDAVTSEPALYAHLPRVPGRYLSSVSGSLGWGLPASLGVALGRPDDEIIAVLGDGAIQFALPALWTADRLNLRVIVLVVNNESYAAVRSALRRFRPGSDSTTHPGTDISGVDLAGVSRAFGVPATRIATASGLAAAVAAARASRRPTLIEAMTDPQQFPGRQAAVPSQGLANPAEQG